jgi:hypothetical protein
MRLKPEETPALHRLTLPIRTNIPPACHAGAIRLAWAEHG